MNKFRTEFPSDHSELTKEVLKDWFTELKRCVGSDPNQEPKQPEYPVVDFLLDEFQDEKLVRQYLHSCGGDLTKLEYKTFANCVDRYFLRLRKQWAAYNS